MSTLSLRLPDSLHKRIRALAKQEGISINQLISTAVAEKMAALMTLDYLEERAKRGSQDRYRAVLAKVPDAAPEHSDTFVSVPGGRPLRSDRRGPSSRPGAR